MQCAPNINAYEKENCFELRHENLKKIKNCMPQPKKLLKLVLDMEVNF